MKQLLSIIACLVLFSCTKTQTKTNKPMIPLSQNQSSFIAVHGNDTLQSHFMYFGVIDRFGTQTNAISVSFNDLENRIIPWLFDDTAQINTTYVRHNHTLKVTQLTDSLLSFESLYQDAFMDSIPVLFIAENLPRKN